MRWTRAEWLKPSSSSRAICLSGDFLITFTGNSTSHRIMRLQAYIPGKRHGASFQSSHTQFISPRA